MCPTQKSTIFICHAHFVCRAACSNCITILDSLVNQPLKRHTMPLTINRPLKILSYAATGFILRLVASATFKETLSQRVEISTPVSSWKRAQEAVYLWNSGLDPYSGIFHEYPISLALYRILINYCNTDLVFAAVDTITALLLYLSVGSQLSGEEEKDTAERRSQRVLIVYLLSPLTIVSCAGNSTSTLTNFLIAAIFSTVPYRTLNGLTSVLVAFLACNNIYFGALIVPIAFHRRNNTIPIFIIAVATLLIASYLMMDKSGQFLSVVYLFTLKIQDLTPNIGMLWYFFTEMFEHFLGFYTWIAQINAFIHVIPLTIYLRESPHLALYVITLSSTILQPYPSIAYVGLLTSLLPQWEGLTSHMKRGLFISCSAITCIALWPVFWHLWIVMGTANANFYFGATLAFSATLIFLLLDLLNAYGYVTAKKKLSEKQ